MVRASSRPRRDVTLRECDKPLAYVQNIGHGLGNHVRRSEILPGFYQFGGITFFENVDLIQQFAGLLRLNAGQQIHDDRPAAGNLPRGESLDAVIAEKLQQFVPVGKAHTHLRHLRLSQ
jgi:hypothetical protein